MRIDAFQPKPETSAGAPRGDRQGPAGGATSFEDFLRGAQPAAAPPPAPAPVRAEKRARDESQEKPERRAKDDGNANDGAAAQAAAATMPNEAKPKPVDANKTEHGGATAP